MEMGMADEPQSLVLEHLRAIRDDVSSLRDDMRDDVERIDRRHDIGDA